MLWGRFQREMVLEMRERQSMRTRLSLLEGDVLEAARAYVTEVENPSPGLAYRASLRARLVEADNRLRNLQIRAGLR